jgi:hypothetical protein
MFVHAPTATWIGVRYPADGVVLEGRVYCFSKFYIKEGTVECALLEEISYLRSSCGVLSVDIYINILLLMLLLAAAKAPIS